MKEEVNDKQLEKGLQGQRQRMLEVIPGCRDLISKGMMVQTLGSWSLPRGRC